MPPITERDWVRLLRPLVLNGEAITDQLGRRLGVAIAATILFGGLMAFFLAIFVGFGHWRVGLTISLMLCPILAWIWASHLILRRRVKLYLAERAADAGPRSHRPD